MASLVRDFLGGPNYSNVEAIRQYVEDQRPKIPKYPGLQSAIEEFELWYQNLSFYDQTIVPDSVMQNAVYYRDKINGIMGSKVDPTWVQDVNHVIGVKPSVPLISTSTWLKIGAVTIIGILGYLGFKVVKNSPAGLAVRKLLPGKSHENQQT